MKKIILSSIFAVALIAIAGYGIDKSIKVDPYLSDLALSNIEALAGDETGDGGTLPELIVTCSAGSHGRCWDPDFEPLPFYRTKVTCPVFSGNINIICVPGIYPI